MSEDWDFYLCTVDGKLASMYVDLGRIHAAPMAGLPFMACVRLRLGAPREDGMSSNEEYEALIEVEDALTGRLVDEGAVYVGRCTTDGFRDFYFYVARTEGWEQRVADCMSFFPGYAFEALAREEPDWLTYLSYLYPNAAQWQTISNRRVCDALLHNGDPLIEAREIDHWAYFPDESCRNAFVEEALGLGYALRSIHRTDDDERPWCAQVWRIDVPGFDRIDAATTPLFDLAGKFDGYYDGWESVVLGSGQPEPPEPG
jgi:regulator of RNase E activity RraB